MFLDAHERYEHVGFFFFFANFGLLTSFLLFVPLGSHSSPAKMMINNENDKNEEEDVTTSSLSCCKKTNEVYGRAKGKSFNGSSNMKSTGHSSSGCGQSSGGTAGHATTGRYTAFASYTLTNSYHIHILSSYTIIQLFLSFLTIWTCISFHHTVNTN